VSAVEAKGLRLELVNENLFLGLEHARTKIAIWADDYNQRRPHSALGYVTPAAHAANLSETSAVRANPTSSAARTLLYPRRTA
jgi:putative transposase